jgi:hypothetical protein
MNQTEVVLTKGASGDISKLASGTDRGAVALHALGELLQSGTLTPEQLAQLSQLAKKYEEQPSLTVRAINPAIAQAEKILSTLEVGKDGFAKLTIPAGISDIDAMKALNAYFQEKCPKFERAAILEGDFDWYEKQAGVKSRDSNTERNISIQVVVPNTTDKSRSGQENVLSKQNMTFGSPEEVALVTAAYACANNGKDILKDLFVRTSAPGVALATYQDLGVCVRRCYDDHDDYDVAASGARLPN